LSSLSSRSSAATTPTLMRNVPATMYC